MIRNVHPVGQGSFISEKFIERNGKETIVIYDCGSQTSKKIVEQEIRNSFEKNTPIRVVYISHLDNDHTNGLEFLLKHCCVENIFLPYLSPQALLLSLIKYKCQEEESKEHICSDFVLNLIYYAKEQNKEQFHNRVFEGKKLPNIKFIHPVSDNYDSICSESLDIWRYVAFNNDNTQIKKKFYDLLEKENIPTSLAKDIDDFFPLWQNITFRNRLKKIYQKLDGGINANSLGIISYPLINTYKKLLCYGYNRYEPYYRPHYCIKNIHNTGAIYVGDMDLSDKNAAFYQKKNISQDIGIIQLPHHGSKNNYNRNCNLDCELFIANAGYNNSYGHPSTYVLDDILKKQKNVHIITEQPGSRYREHIIIKD